MPLTHREHMAMVYIYEIAYHFDITQNISPTVISLVCAWNGEAFAVGLRCRAVRACAFLSRSTLYRLALHIATFLAFV